MATGDESQPPVAEQDSRGDLIILKVGTSSLITFDEHGRRVQLANVSRLVQLIASLRQAGHRVVLVSSGAVGMGCIKLNIQKPTDMRTKQAVAAAGQSHLMRMYEDLFGHVRLQVAQLLLSQSDFNDKSHWANIKQTMVEALKLGLVPIVNENDTTNTEELRFGDNDNLAALTAVQMQADWLFLYTDVDCLYTANPRTNPDAKALRLVDKPWELQVDTRDEGSGLGTGGMATKLVAARTASVAGIKCVLLNGQFPERASDFLALDLDAPRSSDDASLPIGTLFRPMAAPRAKTDTRRWIMSLLVSGELLVDDGAAKALSAKKSLLPAGIRKISGEFLRGECVRLMHRGVEAGRALVQLGSSDLEKILGKQSSEFADILGYNCAPEACHRDNIILMMSPESLLARTGDVLAKLPKMDDEGRATSTPGVGLRKNRSFS